MKDYKDITESEPFTKDDALSMAAIIVAIFSITLILAMG